MLSNSAFHSMEPVQVSGTARVDADSPPDVAVSVPIAERWLMNGLEVMRPPAFVLAVDVNMSAALEHKERLRAQGQRITFVHIVARAAALGLRTCPELHRSLLGNSRVSHGAINVSLSVHAETFVAPLLLVENADRKTLEQIAEEVTRAAPVVREEERKRMRVLNTAGWILPFGFMRRALIRILSRCRFFRRPAGSIQITYAPEVDYAIPLTFATTAILCFGKVQQRVVALDGKPAVQPMMTLVCSADHRLWNGKDGQRFVNAVKDAIETMSV